MATQADIVRIALGENGFNNGLGYDEQSKYAQSFGINFGVAYCDIFVAWVFERAGIPLPKMGSWIRSGSQYCPDSYNYAVAHNAIIPSWDAGPADQVIFNWNGDSSPLGGQSHTEIVETYVAPWLYTIGGNSGPSNVDGFKGTGGVHRHAWYCPVGVGNSLIQGVVDTSKLVKFSSAAKPTPVIEGDWLSVATQAEVEAALDKVLAKWFGGAVGPGQKTVAGTIGATLANVEGVYNIVNEIKSHFAAPKVG